MRCRSRKASPEAREVSVERVKPLRFAEASGRYEAIFKQRNDSARTRYPFQVELPVAATQCEAFFA
jgi:hypothetical protein